MSSIPKEGNVVQPQGERNTPGKEIEDKNDDMPLSECLETVRQRVNEGKRLSTEIQPLYEFAKEFQDEAGESGEQGNSLKITLPGSNYIGPGNPINAGEPTNSADKIALIHDWAYEFAETEQDVKEADLLAITLFEKEYKKSGNWQALVGNLGLRAKHFIEKKINQVIYPVLPSDTTDDNAEEKEEVKKAEEAAGTGGGPDSTQPDGASGSSHRKPEVKADSEQRPPKTEPESLKTKCCCVIS